MKRIYAFLIILLSIASYSNYGFACSCEPPGSPSEELDARNAVFAGTVTEVTLDTLDTQEVVYRVRFMVQEVWKGIHEKEVIVTTLPSTASCGFPFEQGISYLVYISFSSAYNSLFAHLCGRTKELSYAEEDLQELGPGTIDPSWVPFSDDAILLALQNQEGIRLDWTLATEIEAALVAARAEVDTLQFIHVFPLEPHGYVPNELHIGTSALWSQAWKQEQLQTGEAYIDSLSLEYGLVEAEDRRGDFRLIFAIPLEMRQLSELYQRHPDITDAHPVAYGGDGDNIEYFRKNGVHHFAFSHGWGDCLAGCEYKDYWYVSVTPSDTGYVAYLEEEKHRDFSGPYIYRWNIPDRYPITSFESVDQIFYSIRYASEWWVRRHAIEGSWRLLVGSSPGMGGDVNEHWYELKAELEGKVSALRAVLEIAVSDPDPDVRASAAYALSKIRLVSIQEESLQPWMFALHPNYPNPFNPRTTIAYDLPQACDVTLTIYALTGQKVGTVVSEIQEAGRYEVVWDGSGFGNGVYLYRLQARGFVATKRMMLLR